MEEGSNNPRCSRQVAFGHEVVVISEHVYLLFLLSNRLLMILVLPSSLHPGRFSQTSSSNNTIYMRILGAFIPTGPFKPIN